MKIRDRLIRRQRRFIAIMAIAIGCWAAVVLVARLTSPGTPPDWMFLVLVGLLGPILFAIAGLKYLVRCPKCNGNLGGRFGSLSGRKFLWVRPVVSCPYCGVGLDQAAP